MARNTGATVIVPIYPLDHRAPPARSPAIADLISSQIDQHGARMRSLRRLLRRHHMLAAVQELVRRGDPVPWHMVLISPSGRSQLQ